MLTPCYIPDALLNGAVRPPLAGWFARTYGATSGYFVRRVYLISTPFHSGTVPKLR